MNTKWLWWFHEWYELEPSYARQRLDDQMNDNHHNLPQWTLQGIDALGHNMFAWVEWPRETVSYKIEIYIIVCTILVVIIVKIIFINSFLF